MCVDIFQNSMNTTHLQKTGWKSGIFVNDEIFFKTSIRRSILTAEYYNGRKIPRKMLEKIWILRIINEQTHKQHQSQHFRTIRFAMGSIPSRWHQLQNQEFQFNVWPIFESKFLYMSNEHKFHSLLPTCSNNFNRSLSGYILLSHSFHSNKFEAIFSIW